MERFEEDYSSLADFLIDNIFYNEWEEVSLTQTAIILLGSCTVGVVNTGKDTSSSKQANTVVMKFGDSLQIPTQTDCHVQNIAS